MIELRDYQVDCIARVRAALRRHRSVLLQAPTGAGKTNMAAFMLGGARARGKSSWFVVHRRELIKQSTRAFLNVGVPHGVIAAGWLPSRHELVQIAGIQTAVNRLDRYPKPDVIVWDEAHHSAAGMWAKLFAANPNGKHIGITATPERLDGAGLCNFFDEMIEGPSVRWLIDHGYLARYRLICEMAKGIDLSSLHKVGGDYNRREVDDMMSKAYIVGDTISLYKQHAAGLRAIMFQRSIKASQEAVGAFRAAGIPAEHVDGDTDPMTRDGAIGRFERGETLVLSNVDLFGEGFDVPAAEALLDSAPTASLGRAMQRWGRVLRPYQDRVKIIIDQVGNTGKIVGGEFVPKHGLPDDDRQWTLAGRMLRQPTADEGVALKRCPECLKDVESWRKSCNRPRLDGSICGHIFETIGRQVDVVDGHMGEVDLAMQRYRAERVEPSPSRKWTKADFLAEAMKRGIRNPHAWAHHAFQQQLLHQRSPS